MIGTPLVGLLQFYNIIMRIYYKYCDIIFREQHALAMQATHLPPKVSEKVKLFRNV
jgi:selenocysteine lyase/cysteine desulfurase